MAKIAAQMGESATSITPSNTSPVALAANTPVNPTASGYAIASYSSVTPSSTGTSVSTNDVVKFDGNGVILDAMPGPATSLAPSNSNPPSISTGNTYLATDTGYAISSYSGVTPSNSSPAVLSPALMYKPSALGFAIESYTSVTPSSTQTAVSSGDIVKIGGSGIIVDSVPTPTSITPSNSSPVALTANTAVKPTASGYAIASYSSITPSNSSPVSLSSGSFYKPSASGYAISSYSSKTPSDTSPASVSSGAIIKASSAGYLHKTAQGFTNYPLKIRNTSSSTSLSLTGLTSSKNYLLLVWNWGGSVSYSDTRFDSTTASGASLTKIANLRDTGGSNIRVAGTFFLMKTSSTSVTLSNTNQMLALVFMAE